MPSSQIRTAATTKLTALPCPLPHHQPSQAKYFLILSPPRKPWPFSGNRYDRCVCLVRRFPLTP